MDVTGIGTFRRCARLRDVPNLGYEVGGLLTGPWVGKAMGVGLESNGFGGGGGGVRFLPVVGGAWTLLSHQDRHLKILMLDCVQCVNFGLSAYLDARYFLRIWDDYKQYPEKYKQSSIMVAKQYGDR